MSVALSAEIESSTKEELCPGAVLYPCKDVCMTADATQPLVDQD